MPFFVLCCRPSLAHLKPWFCVDSPLSFFPQSGFLSDLMRPITGVWMAALGAKWESCWHAVEWLPYHSPYLSAEMEGRCLGQSLAVPQPDLAWRVTVLDGCIQLFGLAPSQWHLVVSCLEAAKETQSLRYCCFAFVLWAAALDEGHRRMFYSVLGTCRKLIQTCLHGNHLVL